MCSIRNARQGFDVSLVTKRIGLVSWVGLDALKGLEVKLTG